MAWFMATLPGGSTFSIAGMKILYRSIFNTCTSIGWYFPECLNGIPPGFSQCLISVESLQWRIDIGWWFLERNENHSLLCPDYFEEINMDVIRYYYRNLRGYCTPNLKLVCFVCYFKIISTFSKDSACIFNKVNCLRNWKMALKFL